MANPLLRQLALWLALAVCSSANGAPTGSGDAPVVTLYYNQRVPYSYLENGVLKGHLVEVSERIFQQAGIAFRWDSLPIARQFITLRDNNEPLCLVGRFMTREREAWGHYSLPIYRDQPQGLLVRRDNARMRSYATLKETISAPDVRLLVKRGYSYGAVIDNYLKQRKPPAKDTVDENHNMLRQIHLAMADAMIIAEDEAAGLLAHSGLPTTSPCSNTRMRRPANCATCYAAVRSGQSIWRN